MFTMANYILDLLTLALADVDRLTVPDSLEKDLLRATLERKASLAARMERSEKPEDQKAFAMFNQIAEQVVAIQDKLDPPGSFINVVDEIREALTVRCMIAQESNPEYKEAMLEAREKVRQRFDRQNPDPEPEAAEGTQGPRVYVVPRAVVENLLNQEPLVTGFSEHPPISLGSLRAFGHFTERAPAETNPDLKQVIPYAVLVHEGRVFCYTRGKKGEEARLHAASSIGVGGHLDPEDLQEFSKANGADFFEDGLLRELREEVGLVPGHIERIEFLGFVNNEENEVGQVHIGLVYVIHLDNLVGMHLEDSLVHPRWIDSRDLLLDRAPGAELEAWSKLIAPMIFVYLNPLPQTFIPHDDEAGPGPGYVNQDPPAPKPSDADFDEPLPKRQGGCDGETCESCQ